MLLPSKNVPRWTIFLIDVFLTVFSLSIAYLIRFDFINFNKQIWEQEYEVLKFAFPIFIFVRMLSFLVSKTYAGIIRYTSTQDTKRLFSTVTLGTVIFLTISFIKNIF